VYRHYKGEFKSEKGTFIRVERKAVGWTFMTQREREREKCSDKMTLLRALTPFAAREEL